MMHDGSYEHFHHESDHYDNHRDHGYPPSLLDMPPYGYDQPGKCMETIKMCGFKIKRWSN